MFSDDRQDVLMKLAVMKGATLHIFIALLIAGTNLNRRQIMTYAGCGKDAFGDGITRLETMGAVLRRGGRYATWELVPNWRQLPLPLLFLSEGGKSALEGGENPPSPVTRDLLTFTTTTKQIDQEAVVSNAGAGACEVTAGKAPSPVDNLIKSWLERGGVGPNSPQMQQLMAKQLDLNYIKAHVLERLAQVQAGNGRFGVGLLITRLSAGDAPPAMRCEECLKIEQECRCNGQYIPPELRSIIKS